MRVILLIFIASLGPSILLSQDSVLSKNSVKSDESLKKYSGISLLYEFDIHFNFDNSMYSNRNGLGIGLNLGYTARLNKKLGYSFYATAQAGVGHLGLTTRVNHQINERLWLGYALGAGARTNNIRRSKHVSLEASINGKKNYSAFIRSNFVFDDSLEGQRQVVNIGLRTRGKAAAWTSGIGIPIIYLLIFYAIGGSK